MSSDIGAPIRQRIKQFWLPAILVVGLALFLASGAHRAISWQVIALHYGQITSYADANILIAALGFLLLYAVAVAFSLPIALPLTLTGGAVFGWLAVALVLVGATAGAGVVFIAARTAFADIARRRAGPLPPVAMTLSCSGVQRSSSHDRTNDRCTPNWRWWPLQSRHMSVP